MKFTIVTQWVKIPPVQSLANGTVANPAGKSGNGSPKPGGARVQTAGLSPEMCIVVDPRITTNCQEGSQSRRRQCSGRQQSTARKRRALWTPPGSKSGACTHRGHLGTWESPLSPCL